MFCLSRPFCPIKHHVQIPSDLEEMLERKRSNAEAGSSAAGEAPINCTKKEQEKRKRKDKKPKPSNSLVTDCTKGAMGTAAGSMKMSTAINLLDPVAALQASKAALVKRLAPLTSEDKQLSLAALEAYPASLQSCMLALGHVEPTPVQERVWPGALAGRDVQAVAEPGSGKTLAYVLPGVARIAVSSCLHYNPAYLHVLSHCVHLFETSGCHQANMAGTVPVMGSGRGVRIGGRGIAQAGRMVFHLTLRHDGGIIMFASYGLRMYRPPSTIYASRLILLPCLRTLPLSQEWLQQQMDAQPAFTAAGPLMLVLLPTRELALQVAGQCRALRAPTGLRTVCVYGGVPKEPQVGLHLSAHVHQLCACGLCMCILSMCVIVYRSTPG